MLTAGGLVAAAVIVGGVLLFTGDGGSNQADDGDGGDDGEGGSLGGGSSTLGSGDQTVRILNWQAYIDPTEDGAVGTLDRFREATGVRCSRRATPRST